MLYEDSDRNDYYYEAHTPSNLRWVRSRRSIHHLNADSHQIPRWLGP